MGDNYTFSNFKADVQLWQLVTDIAPHRQAATIVKNLSTEARSNVIRQIDSYQIRNGGVHDGRQLDPVSFLLAKLSNLYGDCTGANRSAARNTEIRRRLQGNDNPLYTTVSSREGRVRPAEQPRGHQHHGHQGHYCPHHSQQSADSESPDTMTASSSGTTQSDTTTGQGPLAPAGANMSDGSQPSFVIRDLDDTDRPILADDGHWYQLDP